MAVITALKVQVRRANRVSVFLDGEFALGISKAVAKDLQVGQVLQAEDLAALQAAEQVEAAVEQAQRLIALRPRSEQELRRRWEQKQVPPELQDLAARRLLQSGLIDDRAFAAAWIENRAAFRPRGLHALRAELRRKGVSNAVISAALEGFDERKAALEAGRKGSRRLEHLSEDDYRKRLGGYLARRGFPYSAIAEVVRMLWEETGGSRQESEDEQWDHS